MKKLEMEIKVCEELIRKVQNGDFKGRKVVNEIQSGNYLKGLECEKIDPELFKQASREADEKLQFEIRKALKNSNFVTRHFIMNVKFGNSLADKLIVDGLNDRIKEINKLLESEKKKNPSYYIPDKNEKSTKTTFRYLNYLNPLKLYQKVKNYIFPAYKTNNHNVSTNIKHSETFISREEITNFHKPYFAKILRQNIRMNNQNLVHSLVFENKFLPNSGDKKISPAQKASYNKLLDKLNNNHKNTEKSVELSL